MTRTHGFAGSERHPLYERWKGMHARCKSPAHVGYHRYGGRGITVCPRWEDFTLFLADMEASFPGPGYELHRVDNDGPYSPENCVWLRKSEHMAVPKSAEHREAIGAAHRGRKHPPEQTERQAAATRVDLDADWLREQYVDLGRSVYAIAADAGCGKSSVHRAIQRAEISR